MLETRNDKDKQFDSHNVFQHMSTDYLLGLAYHHFQKYYLHMCLNYSSNHEHGHEVV